MHEFSIAMSLLELVADHTPARASVRTVRVRVGPLQAIEPEAMRFAWQAATEGTPFEGAELTLEMIPWQLSCKDCGRQWTSEHWSDPCDCGSCMVDPVGGDELTLLSMDVDEDQPVEPDETHPVMRHTT